MNPQKAHDFPGQSVSLNRLVALSGLLLALGFLLSGARIAAAAVAVLPLGKEFHNSVGQRLLRLEPGRFSMGQDSGGNADERPAHPVTLTRPFYMAATEVTNAQYEQFDPAHRQFRGRRGFSSGDDEAVIFVSWHDAMAYCQWLTKKEGRLYRLPTEAEWEYACRAGSATLYSTGDSLPAIYHKAQAQAENPHPVPLRVGATPPNPWGLCDMHGNVEEWCLDWYGPYEAQAQTDPVGRAAGIFKVTRGGSHNTLLKFLRSANRQGALPEDKQWLTGFRVVLGEAPASEPLPATPAPGWAAGVAQTRFDWPRGAEAAKPLFAAPIAFVRPPATGADAVPFYPHNHCPSLAWCDNGDLLAAWFSTPDESDRDMTILASRLRRGRDTWDEAAEFFKAPDRNMTGSALLNDGKGTLYHFNGIEAAGTWANLALALRTSRDNGATWSAPRLINPDHGHRNQVISGTKLTREGYLIQLCDAVPGGRGGTALHLSRDGGATWTDPGAGQPEPRFEEGLSGAWIAGIHAAVEQLADGSLLALGRDNNIGGRMPLSRSRDLGQTWTYHASEFPPIGSGQRLVLMRLREGPLLLLSFTDSSALRIAPRGLAIADAAGRKHTVYGLFGALSFDEGKSWPVKKLLTAGDPPRKLNGGAWTREFTMDSAHAEPMGYLAATQSPDGVIHLVSSALYYRFNLAWLEER